MATDSRIDNAGLPAGVKGKLKIVDLSICIVTYKARDWLRDCLESLYENSGEIQYEIIVVDNGSKDGIQEMLSHDFPNVFFIENESNKGYTRPMNQALRVGQGSYLMQLNPDTKIVSDAIYRLLKFMDENSQVGICSPKVLNQDGTLQKQCRRGEPRPLAVISYFLGLSRLFPNSKKFGQYLLDYEDEDEIMEVDAVSGSCMLIRREVVDKIGYLDEQFYAYQEDTDYCTRARLAGWKVSYMPTAQIIHYGGRGGTRVEPYRSIIEWHKSYWLYYRKHLARDYFFLFNWLYYLLMIVKLALNLSVSLFRQERFAGPKR